MSKLTWLMITVSSKHMFHEVYGSFFVFLKDTNEEIDHMFTSGGLTVLYIISDVFHISAVTCCGLGWRKNKQTWILMSKCVLFDFFSSCFLPWHQNWRMKMFISACQNSAAHRAHTVNKHWTPTLIPNSLNMYLLLITLEINSSGFAVTGACC